MASIVPESSVAALILLLLASPVAKPSERPNTDMHQQHDVNDPGHFYSRYCCNLQDCRPIEDSDVKLTKKGYSLFGGKYIIPYGDTRIKISGDSKYHACERVGEWGETYIQCLYIPPTGA